jgi:hypothetical protein
MGLMESQELMDHPAHPGSMERTENPELLD